MSRGLGKVQRNVLDLLYGVDPDMQVPLDMIALRLFGRRPLAGRPERKHLETTRRALIALERRGLVELYYVKAGDLGGVATTTEGNPLRQVRRHLAAAAVHAPESPDDT